MDNRPTIAEVQEWVLKLYNTCEQTITSEERKEQHKYAVMVQRPQDKKFLVKMLDESSQIRDRKKLAERIKKLIDRYGVPEFLNKRDAFLFKMYQAFGHHFDFIAIPIIKKRLRMDTSKVILDEARPKLTAHLAARFKQKIGQNVNLLGEVVLGNGEADHRYFHYLEALEAPDINYISVKISGIYAQTHALNYEESFPELVKRMCALYQKAIDFPYVDENGVKRSKFVNLDMEEYKDAHFTLRLFKEVLSRPEFKNYSAGIVVQAYLPDAYEFQTELLDFAKARMADGGAPLKMRLVKGCNLEMETVISSLRGWPNPVRTSKTEVDANYLHILERALLPENAKALHVGVASHNLFTIAYAYLLSRKLGSAEYMTFEMLEGMADHVWRAQSQLGNHVILYAPVVKDEHFLNAVSYLVRRMDENTAPDNFLTHSFNLKPGTDTWRFLQNQFGGYWWLAKSCPLLSLLIVLNQHFIKSCTMRQNFDGTKMGQNRRKIKPRPLCSEYPYQNTLILNTKVQICPVINEPMSLFLSSITHFSIILYHGRFFKVLDTLFHILQLNNVFLIVVQCSERLPIIETAHLYTPFVRLDSDFSVVMKCVALFPSMANCHLKVSHKDVVNCMLNQ